MGNPTREHKRLSFDEDFIRLLKAKDEKSYLALRTFCRDYIVKYTLDHKEAEDIASLVIVKVIPSIQAFDPASGRGSVDTNFRSWIKTIAYNCFLDAKRREKAKMTFSELATALDYSDDERKQLVNESSSVEDCLSSRIYADNPIRDNPQWILAVKEVLAVVNEIKPVRARIALLLFYLHDFTTTDVALIMNEKFYTVQTLIHRTRKKLYELFLKKGIDAHYLERDAWGIKLRIR